MARKSINFGLSLCFLWAVISACSHQKINEDPIVWSPFETRFEDITIIFYTPPDGKIFGHKPIADVSGIDKVMQHSSIGSIGYDYGLKSSGNLSNYKVNFSIAKNFDEGIAKMISNDEFEKVVVNYIEHLNNTDIYKYKRDINYTTINKKSWIQVSFDYLDSGADGFYTKLNEDYYLIVSGVYKESIYNEPALLAQRKLLTRKIAEKVQIIK